MAAYPSYYWQRAGTKTDIEAGINPVRASNGTLKVRRLYSADKRDWLITHWLTSAERTTFDTFYTTNRNLTVDLTPPDTGGTYSARFAAAPQYEQRDGFWIVAARLVEV